jgi:hypothetical protein
MRRAVALGLLLFAVYAATLGLDAFGGSDYAGAEPHYLLAAQSIVEDHDVDLANEYAARSYEAYYPYTLRPHGRDAQGILYEVHGVGYPLLIAPAYALGGAKAVELMMAALTALCMALAYRLALRVVPDPWALGATLAVGLSTPLLAYGTAVDPGLLAALVLVAAALLALNLDERVSRGGAFACFGLLGLLPWLETELIPVALVVGAYAARSLLRARRRTLAVGASEVAFFSVALYVGINESLYGGVTPYSAGLPGESVTGAGGVADHLERAYRLVALFIDRDYGLLRWAPAFALAFLGVAALCRSRFDGLARAMPGLRAEERAATMCALAVCVQLLVAAFLAPTMFGPWFPGRHLLAALPLAAPLVALGLRRLPRLGAALAVVSVAASAWLYAAARWGSDKLVDPRPNAPFGPLTAVLPRFDDAVWPYALAAALTVALAAGCFSAFARAS